MSKEAFAKTVVEMPSEVLELIEQNNQFIKAIQKRIENNTKRWLRPKEVAKYMSVSVGTVFNLKDQIGYSKIHQVILFDINDIDAFMESRKKRRD